MQHRKRPCPRIRRNTLATALSTALSTTLAAGSFMPAAAQAQQATAAAETRRYDIPAGELGASLNRIAEISGRIVSVPPALVRGLGAPALAGSYTTDEAMRRVLAGSGLEPYATDGGTLSVRPAPRREESRILGEVTVAATALGDGTTEGSGSYTATGPTATATRLGLSSRETPQSVSVITRQQMDDQGITLLADVVRQTTGLTLTKSGGNASVDNAIYSRGFAVENFQIDGVARVNGSSLTAFLVNDMALYDRVEIVRGATGLMNGVGTPSATLNMIRKRPTAEFQGYAQATVGSWDSYRAEVDVSSALNEAGTVRGRVVAATQENGSQVDYEKERKHIFYAVVDADLGPDTLASAGVAMQEYKATGTSRTGRPLFYSDGSRTDWSRSDSAAARWAESERNNLSLFASLEHRFANDWKVKGTLTYDKSEMDNWLGYAANGYPNRATGAGSGLWAAHWIYEPEQTAFDLYASGPFSLFGREHELVIGASHSYTKDRHPRYTWWYFSGWSPSIGNIYTWDGTTPARPDNPRIGTEDQEQRIRSAYATVRLRPTDALSLILGARVTDWEDESCSAYYSGSSSCTRRNESGQQTPYAGLTYDFHPNWSAYASYTNIFKPQTSKDTSGSYLDPLMGNAYEAGVKGEFFDKQLNIGAAVYRILQDNYAVSIPGVQTPDGSQAYRAASGTKTRGFEVEVSGRLTSQWQVSTGFSRNIVQDRNGDALNTQVPTNTFKLFSSYLLPQFGQGLTVGGGMRWQNRSWSDFTYVTGSPRVTQEAYAVVDLMAHYAFDKHTSLSVNLYNLFDKEYQAVSSSSYYGEGRNLRATLQYRF